MPEFRQRSVLITRPMEDAARTAEAVVARGFHPVVAPFLAIRHVFPRMPRGMQAILVTSGNALPGLPVVDLPLLAVGDVTAGKARQAGFARVESAGGDVSSLLALARQRLRPDGGPLLLACGLGQGAVTASAFRKVGFTVVRRVTYATEPVEMFPDAARDALESDALHAALFLSGETAAAFVRLFPQELAPRVTTVMALTIGKMAVDALRTLPWRQIRLASAPTLDNVLALL